MLLFPTYGNTNETEWQVAEQFADSYNAWVQLKRSTPPGIVSRDEITVWHKAQKAFKHLNQIVNY